MSRYRAFTGHLQGMYRARKGTTREQSYRVSRIRDDTAAAPRVSVRVRVKVGVRPW